MSKFPLNLSQYKKTKDDKDYAILKHPHGHEIKIAKSPLKPELRKQLERLPMYPGDAVPGPEFAACSGGSVQDKMAEGGEPKAKPSSGPYINPKSAKEIQAGATKSGWQPEEWKKNIKEGLGLYNGGQVETPSKPFDTERPDSESTNYAEGGPVYANSANQSASLKENYNQKQLRKKHIASGAAAQYAEGGDVEDKDAKEEAAKHITINFGTQQPQPITQPSSVGVQDNPNTPNDQSTQQIAGYGKTPHQMNESEGPFNQDPFKLGIPAQPAANGQPPIQGITPPTKENEEVAQQKVADNQQQSLANAAYAPVQSPQQPQDDQQDPFLASNQVEAKGLAAAYNNQLSGIQSQANAQGHLGKEQSAIEMKLVKDQQEAANAYQDNLHEIENERTNLAEDVANEHIKPEHYMAELGTGKRIMTAIGLILGGMGAGLTGGENPALKYLNAQIDRDIDAQKSELGKKQKLLAANHHRFQDADQAYQMTKINMTDIAIHNLAAQAAKAQNPIEQARAQQAIGVLQQQNAARAGQLAMMKTLMTQQAKSGQSQSDPARLVPSLVPKEERNKVFEEIKSAQNIKKLAPAIVDAFNKASQFSLRKSVGGHSSGQKSFLALMGPTVGEQEGSVRAALFKSIEDNMLPKWGDTPSELADKRKTLTEYLQAKSSAPTAKGYGIDLSKYQSTSPYGEQMNPMHERLYNAALKNPEHPQSKAILKKLGK